jgi:hypothetical protein
VLIFEETVSTICENGITTSKYLLEQKAQIHPASAEPSEDIKFSPREKGSVG